MGFFGSPSRIFCEFVIISPLVWGSRPTVAQIIVRVNRETASYEQTFEKRKLCLPSEKACKFVNS